jgi:glycosyltransferase involved in cell wall biosynthesis
MTHLNDAESSNLRAGTWFSRDDGEGETVLLSIITVVRREHDALLSTLKSFVVAGLGGSELIVIEGDDQDSDAATVVRAFAADNFRMMHWLLAPDAGIYDAMNRGILAARGEWIWFINAADMVYEDLRYEEIAAYLGGCSEEWVLACARLVGGDAATPQFNQSTDFVLHKLQSGKYVPCHQAVFTKRLALAAVSGFDSRYQISADYDLFLKLSRRNSPAVWNQVVVNYRVGGASEIRWRRRNIEALQARHRTLPTPALKARLIQVAQLVVRLATPHYIREMRLKRACQRTHERSSTSDR